MAPKIRPPSGEQWTIKSGDHEAVVVQVGGGLRRYAAGGRDVVDGYASDELSPGGAGQVMAPWPNRIRDGRYTFAGRSYQLALSEPAAHNAIHGLVRWLSWSAAAEAADQVRMACTLPAQPGYPWTLELTTTWSVDAGGLRAAHAVVNASATACPFGLGAHPYLLAGQGIVDDLRIRIPARTHLLCDARGLPMGAARVVGGDYDYTASRRIGSAALDTAFGELPEAGSEVVLSTMDDQPQVTIWADQAFRWWQLYTGDTLPAPRNRRSVAVEPMTCPPDAFHSGRDLVILEPGQAWHGCWGIRPEN
jgi:aldose 1-epimerase